MAHGGQAEEPIDVIMAMPIFGYLAGDARDDQGGSHHYRRASDRGRPQSHCIDWHGVACLFRWNFSIYP